jgi:hypothetical protein
MSSKEEDLLNLFNSITTQESVDQLTYEAYSCLEAVRVLTNFKTEDCKTILVRLIGSLAEEDIIKFREMEKIFRESELPEPPEGAEDSDEEDTDEWEPM